MPIAYTYYALFEWSLIFSDLAFDAVSMIDFEALEIRVVDVGMGGTDNYDVSSSSFNELRTFGGGSKSKSIVSPVRLMDSLSFAADVYLGMIVWEMKDGQGKFDYFGVQCCLPDPFFALFFVSLHRVCVLVNVDIVAVDDLVLSSLAHGSLGLRSVPLL